MAWYHIVNAKSASDVADRDAEDLLRAFSAALRDTDSPLDAVVLYGRTHSGARLYSFLLSHEVDALTERILAPCDATVLAAPPLSQGWSKYDRGNPRAMASERESGPPGEACTPLPSL